MSEVLNGRPVVAAIQQGIKLEVQQMKDKGIIPTMGIIRVGNRPEDIAYENSILKHCEGVGVMTELFLLEEDIDMTAFVPFVKEINENSSIHGILLFRPLPPQLDIEVIKHLISPIKDIDCMNPISLGRVFEGMQEGFAPCTPKAVMEILKYYEVPLVGANAVIINSSSVVGRPLGMLMLDQKATITLCHSKTRNLSDVAANADIVVTAVGKPQFFGLEYFNENAIVIDVGINECEDGGICGDVNYDQVSQKVRGLSPVPGGVGAVTTSILVRHVIEACKKQFKL